MTQIIILYTQNNIRLPYIISMHHLANTELNKRHRSKQAMVGMAITYNRGDRFEGRQTEGLSRVVRGDALTNRRHPYLFCNQNPTHNDPLIRTKPVLFSKKRKKNLLDVAKDRRRIDLFLPDSSRFRTLFFFFFFFLLSIISIRGNNVLVVLLHNTEDTIIKQLVHYSDVSDIQVMIWIFCHLNTGNCIQF